MPSYNTVYRAVTDRQRSLSNRVPLAAFVFIYLFNIHATRRRYIGGVYAPSLSFIVCSNNIYFCLSFLSLSFSQVVDEDGEMVPFGSPGELVVRGYNTMIGYWNDPEKTRQTLSEDGWLKTG